MNYIIYIFKHSNLTGFKNSKYLPKTTINLWLSNDPLESIEWSSLNIPETQIYKVCYA